MSDSETQKIYDAKAEDYANLTGREHNTPELSAFVAALPNGAHVLDLGCGPGHAAGRMATLGFAVEAVDASAEMVRLAAAHDGVKAQQAEFDDLDAVELYDGVYANFSLLHAQRADLPRHLSQIARALKEGGIFHIGMKLGTGTARDALGRRYCYVSEQELQDLLHEAGFSILSTTSGSDLGLDGTMADWVTYLSRKDQD